MNPELKALLEASMKRTRRNFIIVEVVFFLLVLMIVAAIFTDPLITLGTQIALSIFGVGVILLIVMLARFLVKPSPLVEILENAPHQVVAVEVLSIVYLHGRETRQMNLHFLLKDKKRLVLSDKRSALEALLPLLKSHLRHAEFKAVTQR